MTTHRSITSALAAASTRGNAVVLATVVRVTGSSYGGVGARMLVNVDGTTVGIVSGGCLETDLAEHAREVHAENRARVVTYDTRADDDAAWGLGLGCNGLIDVLLEPLSASGSAEVAALLSTALHSVSPSVLATVTKASSEVGLLDVGGHALFAGDAVRTTGNPPDARVIEFFRSQLDAAIAAGRRGHIVEYNGAEIAFEVISPAVHLVICGSGPDAVPLVRFAVQLGWDVSVIDHRPVAHAPVPRFPGASVVECAEARELRNAVALTSRTAAVVMSHHYARDVDYVQALIERGVAYVGILGPRARTERMFADIEARTERATPRSESVFGPVGLDIGGDGPDAIALAIVAEVAAVTSVRPGGHLRDRNAPLHDAAREPGYR